MSIYSQKSNQKTVANQETSLNQITRLIDPSAKKILDVGCSSGYLGQFLLNNSRNKLQIDGIEINKSDRNKAEKILHRVFNINLNSYSAISRQLTTKYDAILFADVLEHTIDSEKTLSCFLPFLKPNGQIIISLPNVTNQSVLLEMMTGQWNYEPAGLLDHTHLNFFDYRRAVNLIESNHLFIQKINFTIFDLPTNKIKEILSENNLPFSPEVIKIIKNPHSKIFQFIISAQKKPIKNYVSYQKTTPILPNSQWIKEWEKIFDYTKKLEERLNYIELLLEKEVNIDIKYHHLLSQKNFQINQKDNQIRLLQESLDKIHQMSFWKLAKVIKKICTNTLRSLSNH